MPPSLFLPLKQSLREANMPLISTRGAASAQGFGEFAQSGPVNYIEDVFSTYLYTGNGSTQTITNEIDLSTKGGLVWMKGRSGATDHALYDTTRGATKDLVSNSTAAETTQSTGLTAFNTTGFSIGALAKLNTNAATYVSWTFRKQPKFFDVVTYTGTGANRTVAHNLGSVPGCIIVKRVTSDGNWQVYHRSVGNNKSLYLNDTGTGITGSAIWQATTPTATEFYVGSFSEVNQSGQTFIAYLFAHDAGGFGLSGTDNVISCGSYTGTGASPGPRINLGWEPQFILYKAASTTGDWGIHDSMRGLGVGTSSTSGSGNRLEPNTSDAETGASNFANIDATGFTITATVSDINGSGQTYIYIAIRRGPMKVPTSGTSVFSPKGAVTLTSGQTVTTGFVSDMAIAKYNGTQEWLLSDRLRNAILYPNTTDSEGALYGTAGPRPFDVQDGFKTSGISGSYFLWGFKRAPGFFDVVCYTGTGVARTVDHNLAAVPELMIVRRRSSIANWAVNSQSLTASDYLYLNSTDPKANNTSPIIWNSTRPTSTVFSVGTSNLTNENAQTFVAYLFATVAGVSKVGSYTGSGTTKQIDCGFTAGARFVLIKRTDSTGDWYVWDTARGIVAGNDPYLLLNSTAAEVTSTDYIDTAATGFEISSTAPAAINANGGSFIFLAIA
jgi:hypothetical protein